ncbi:MAG: hypothetical protein IID45_09775, partial [Planctomycetes bacterium]|nr:hypothetical protein [Planctomycetota bacterium]
KFDEHRQRLGEVWLQKEGLAQTEALNEIYSEEELLRIKKAERSNDLEVLADNVAVDRMEADLASKIRRIGIRNAMRDAVQSEEFDKINTDEEMQAFLQERDKAKLLRGEERDELLEGFRQRKDNRESARVHLVAKLNLERQMEIDVVRAELDYSMKLKRLDHEAALSAKVATNDNAEWQQQIALEKKKAEDRHRESIEELKLNQHTDRLQGEIDLAGADRKVRIAKMDAEITREQDKDQQNRLAAVQKLNDDAAQAQHQREMDRLEQAKDMDAETLIATSDADNAAALADLKKHEADQSVAKALAEERAKMEREKSEAVAEATQKTMDVQQDNAAQMQAMLQQAMKTMGQQSQPTVVMPTAGGVVNTGIAGQTGRVVVCGSCRSENTESARFCSSCGKEL